MKASRGPRSHTQHRLVLTRQEVIFSVSRHARLQWEGDRVAAAHRVTAGEAAVD